MASATCAVVGAGIAGLSAAELLSARGVTVVVLEKSRGVGGRLATRRIIAAPLATGVADHGAQFFTARSSEFRARVAAWQAAGIVDTWYTQDEVRYRGGGGMTAPAKALARNLDVRLGTRATAARRRGRAWQVACEDGSLVVTDALVLTPPVPQTLALLDAGGGALPEADQMALAAVTYDRCLAVLAVLDGPSRVPPPGALESGALDPRLLWIADNFQKGISPAAVTLTLHATPECTRGLWDAADDAVVHDLLTAARDRIGAAVVSAQVHRWRYARPTAVHIPPRLDREVCPPLAFAGDAFAGARVEGAYLSGRRAAEAILAAVG
jgi:predicted NAD/FAD-dependent oxidoreductase